MKLKVNRGFIIQRVNKTIKVFDSENSELLSFNPTATFIFEKIKKGIDSSKIIKNLEEKYNIKSDLARKDFEDLTAFLIQKGILKK